MPRSARPVSSRPRNVHPVNGYSDFATTRCCDGLWGSVPDESIGAIVTATADLEEACQRLIDAANDAGGPDNITAILVQVG